MVEIMDNNNNNNGLCFNCESLVNIGIQRHLGVPMLESWNFNMQQTRKTNAG